METSLAPSKRFWYNQHPQEDETMDKPTECKFCHAPAESRLTNAVDFACGTRWYQDDGLGWWRQSDECSNRVVNAKEKRCN